MIMLLCSANAVGAVSRIAPECEATCAVEPVERGVQEQHFLFGAADVFLFVLLLLLIGTIFVLLLVVARARRPQAQVGLAAMPVSLSMSLHQAGPPDVPGVVAQVRAPRLAEASVQVVLPEPGGARG